jgi:hypothetical protein
LTGGVKCWSCSLASATPLEREETQDTAASWPGSICGERSKHDRLPTLDYKPAAAVIFQAQIGATFMSRTEEASITDLLERAALALEESRLRRQQFAELLRQSGFVRDHLIGCWQQPRLPMEIARPRQSVLQEPQAESHEEDGHSNQMKLWDRATAADKPRAKRRSAVGQT